MEGPEIVEFEFQIGQNRCGKSELDLNFRLQFDSSVSGGSPFMLAGGLCEVLMLGL